MKISYWQPRVMRHHINENDNEYAIHEVYFSQDGSIVTYTKDALSPGETSVRELKKFLSSCLNENEEKIELGDSHYSYSKEDIEFWIKYIDEPPIDYGC